MYAYIIVGNWWKKLFILQLQYYHQHSRLSVEYDYTIHRADIHTAWKIQIIRDFKWYNTCFFHYLFLPSFRMKSKKLCLRGRKASMIILSRQFINFNTFIWHQIILYEIWNMFVILYPEFRNSLAEKKLPLAPASATHSRLVLLSVRSADWWKYLINVKCLNVNTFNRKFLIF